MTCNCSVLKSSPFDTSSPARPLIPSSRPSDSRWQHCAASRILVWLSDASTLLPPPCELALPFPSLPPSSLSHSLTHSLSLCHRRSLTHTHIPIYLPRARGASPSLSHRHERYYGAKHGISAPRRSALGRGAPLPAPPGRLDLDDTAGTRAL